MAVCHETKYLKIQMSIFNLYSYRNSVAENEVPDVYRYDYLPDGLRVQIVHIWNDAIGPCVRSSSRHHNNAGWAKIHSTVARELGVFELSHGKTFKEKCINYLLESDVRVVNTLDLIEVSFVYIQSIEQLNILERQLLGISMIARDAIKELNERFQRAGVGYQFEGDKIIRIDSELIHSDIVKPAIRFLSEKGFEGPSDEFLNAHTHYRKGVYKAAVTEANNAFESTLKVICDKRTIDYPKGARASDLLKLLRHKGLLPEYLDTSFNQLVATLQSGLPKVRQNSGAHGQGQEPRETPDYVAAYAIHLTAVNIQFLMKAHLDKANYR